MSKRKFVGLVDYLDHRLGSHMQKGAEYQWFCPFCIDRLGDESDHRNLWVNEVRGVAHCFRCGFGAKNLEDLFRCLNNGALRYEELRIIKGERVVPLQSVTSALLEILYAPKQSIEDLKSVSLPSEYRVLADAYEDPPPSLRFGVNYLRKERGVSRRTADRFSIGYCPDGRYAGYLIFPVRQGGEQVYFTSRLCGEDDERKTKNPMNREGYHRRQTCLLNYDNVVGARLVGITEGPLDCAAFPHAVALLGKEMSPVQVALLEALVPTGAKEFVVALDADAGVATERLYEMLDGRVPKVSVLFLPKGDPHDQRKKLLKLLKTRRAPGVRDRLRLRLLSRATGKKRARLLDARRRRPENRPRRKER